MPRNAKPTPPVKPVTEDVMPTTPPPRVAVPAKTVTDHEIRTVVRGRTGQYHAIENRWRSLGLTIDMSEVNEHLARANRHRAESVTYRESVEQALLDTRERYAAGNATFEQLARVSADHDQVVSASSALSRSLNAVVAVSLSQAEQAFAAIVAERVFPALAKAARETAAESAEIYRTLPAHVRSKDDADRAGLDAASAWAKLGVLVRRWDALHAERRKLMHEEHLPTLYQLPIGGLVQNIVHAQPYFLKFAHPEKLPYGFSGPAFQPEQRLAVAVQSGAEPGMYTVDQAERNYTEWLGATEKLHGKQVRDSREGRSGGLIDAAYLAVELMPGVAEEHARRLRMVGVRGVGDVVGGRQ